MSSIRFQLNGRPVEVADLPPTTTALQYLREIGLCGTKEGCAEGDCGACTIVLLDPAAEGGPRYRAVNSCLLMLPMLQGLEIWTIEALADGDDLHPAQAALVTQLGSQCGYCTPGVVMSLFAATYREDIDSPAKLDDQLCGNLCRCTGYRPIRAAAEQVAGSRPKDRFSRALDDAARRIEALKGDGGSPLEGRGIRYSAADDQYSAPASLPALWSAMKEQPGALLICGGTDLALRVTRRFEHLPSLISLEALPELRGIDRGPERWRIGAATPLADLEAASAQDLPQIARMLRFFGSRQIKNRGTIGGNLCNASPVGDLPPILLAHDASAVLCSERGERIVPLDRFFLDYRETALRDGEILLAVDVPIPRDGDKICAYKVSKRRELDISSVSAGLMVRLASDGTVEQARFAYGGMAATPRRASAAEAAAIGEPWDWDTVEAVGRMLGEDFQPLGDHRGSAWYRATVARNLLRGFFDETRQEGSPALPDFPAATVLPRGL